MCKNTVAAVTPGGQENSNVNVGLLNMSSEKMGGNPFCRVSDDLHHSCHLLVYVLQVGQEVLEPQAGEAKEHDQKPGPGTNGQPESRGTDAHATDPSASASFASTNNHSSQPIQTGSGRD